MSQHRTSALRIFETPAGTFERRIVELGAKDLPDHDVLVRVNWSALNYKDALSASGNKGVTRKYPFTPGIDAAGVVEESRDSRWQPGAEVIVTGYDLGMNTPGGFGGFIRVPGDWVVAKPTGLNLRETMILGTAGFTAAQSAMQLRAHGVLPASGPVVVTGAAGGVGSLAVAILSGLGYKVSAVTGRLHEADFLRRMGASEVLPRQQILEQPNRPMLPARWAGAVETAGGPMLETVLRSTLQRATVACCGLVSSAEFKMNVFPFLLRGVRLIGIDSAECPRPERLEMWRLLAGEFKPRRLDEIAQEVDLSGLSGKIDEILQGRVRGRVILRHG